MVFGQPILVGTLAQTISLRTVGVCAVVLCEDKDINDLSGVQFSQNNDSGALRPDDDAYRQTDCKFATLKPHTRVQ